MSAVRSIEIAEDVVSDRLVRRSREIGEMIEELEDERARIYDELGRRSEDEAFAFTPYDLHNFDRPVEDARQ